MVQLPGSDTNDAAAAAASAAAAAPAAASAAAAAAADRRARVLDAEHSIESLGSFSQQGDHPPIFSCKF
jgi:hypothetical protein